jgi:hypothetical protein
VILIPWSDEQRDELVGVLDDGDGVVDVIRGDDGVAGSAEDASNPLAVPRVVAGRPPR